MSTKPFTPYSTLGDMVGPTKPWWPTSERERIAAYDKYEQMYWNDPRQYAIRVLENEEPLYVPNARILVNTTTYYLLKGLKMLAGSATDQQQLDSFIQRERFKSRFNQAKRLGVARGDWAFHLTADPTKPAGERISLEPIHPGMVWLKRDDDSDPTRITSVVLFDAFEEMINEATKEVKLRVSVLVYDKVSVGGATRIKVTEEIYETDTDWWGDDAKLVRTVRPERLLDSRITQFPVFLYKNVEYDEEEYGASELRGLEYIGYSASQQATDLTSSVGLDGMGVYATDGGRPVDDAGNEVDWEVAPGKVVEVPAGSYFRRVEGVGSIAPGLSMIDYLEQKMYTTAGISDVALGNVDVQTAESGIALAIKFMPTLAKINERDDALKEIIDQMFFNVAIWFDVYESYKFTKPIRCTIDASKLPRDAVQVLNELNNLFDRKIISKKYYRQKANEMLGYDIDNDAEDKQILDEAETTAKINALTNPIVDSSSSSADPVQTNANGGNNDQTIDSGGNRSNNGSRPNESSGTEA